MVVAFGHAIVDANRVVASYEQKLRGVLRVGEVEETKRVVSELVAQVKKYQENEARQAEKLADVVRLNAHMTHLEITEVARNHIYDFQNENQALLDRVERSAELILGVFACV